MSQLPNISKLTPYLPAGSHEYVAEIFVKYTFKFIISKPRQTKLGDYRFYPQERRHVITVNGNLNPYAFLITFIHEVAHMVVKIHYTHKVAPHGKEWKNEFKRLMLPMIKQHVFPTSIEKVLLSHMKNPKASSCADPTLYKALRIYDIDTEKLFLEDLQDGMFFRLGKRVFQRIEKRRG